MAYRRNILLSFVGNRDPYVEDSDQFGPVLSLLEVRRFSRVVLFCTGASYVERARSVEEIARRDMEFDNFRFVDIELESPIDYEEVFRSLKKRVEALRGDDLHREVSYSVLLDPGTPQMQTAWFLLVRGGFLDATLLQGVPPRFAAGAYRVKEVDFTDSLLPSVTIPEPVVDAMAVSQQPVVADVGGEPIVARSEVFRDVLSQSTNAARYDVSVLIQGETGTGKTLIAKHIHEESSRKKGVFLSLNCSAISATLAESTLFGQKKGAFTGASSDRLGYFRSADGGTLFLDEIGDLPVEIQPKLLRVLEDGSLSPLGDDREYTVDVRVIAATNHDLEQMVEDGSFRLDLYQRLRQFTIKVPPLRERPADIPLLVAHFADRWNRRYHENKQVSQGAMAKLVAHEWPGNVREISNVVIDMFARARGSVIGEEFLPAYIGAEAEQPAEDDLGEDAAAAVAASSGTDGRAPTGRVHIPPEGLNIRELVSQLERDYYLAALEKAEGNKERAAQYLGITGAAYRKALRERFTPEV
ncbi:MAG: RNA repair transcriptional activator RtcR family protein [Spirochaetota bacterium]